MWFFPLQPIINNQGSVVDGSLPGIGQYKAQIPVKVTTMHLGTTPVWNGGVVYDETAQELQRGLLNVTLKWHLPKYSDANWYRFSIFVTNLLLKIGCYGIYSQNKDFWSGPSSTSFSFPGLDTVHFIFHLDFLLLLHAFV